MQSSKLILISVIAAAIAAFFAFDLGQYLSLEFLREQQTLFAEVYASRPLETLAAFFAIYVGVTALSLPGAAIMTLAAGALFGLVTGTILVSFASTLGATLAFLASRFLFHDVVQQRFGGHLKKINEGVEKDGAFYLFGLRLVPAFPFFAINLVMGLIPMRTWTFYWVSQVGMLAGTVVYVNAGTQLAAIDSLGGLLSPTLIASFAALGLFPLIARKALQFLQSRKSGQGFTRPSRFDRDMVVIGAGSGGLVSAYIAAAVKAEVTLIEADRMGGDCLNTGCVPSKALIRSAKAAHELRHAADFGVNGGDVSVDFPAVMERVQAAITKVEPHDSVERYEGLGVDVIKGYARITSPWSVEVDGRELTTRNIVVATGARPFVPPIPGLDKVGYLTSDSLWQLRKLPKRLAVLGGGPIGSELAQAFSRLGSQVVQIEMGDRLLPREDAEVSSAVYERFRNEGIDVRLGAQATSVHQDGGLKWINVETAEGSELIEFDELLVAVGRKANVKGFGLEELGVELNGNGTIAVDDFLRTNYPNIFAVGDVAGPYQFTHAAAHQAWHAAVNALFGTFKKFRVDYSALPWSTFIDPEVARVGLNEQDARIHGIDYDVTTYDLAELDRAIADGADAGFIKVLTVPGKDRILGATIVGHHAGELISEYVTAIRHGLGMNKLLSTIHVYPTWTEANKYTAGEWKKARVPQRLLAWVARYHAWRRGGRHNSVEALPEGSR
ncbi:MAG: pyridine nucleotide-disulfide oxidoreductase [Gammaproteobacteria bacterium]|nr:MAG: pyridine nucleotide-disulfide oxidoreductase [Gammaproteobacteria bacterium]